MIQVLWPILIGVYAIVASVFLWLAFWNEDGHAGELTVIGVSWPFALAVATVIMPFVGFSYFRDWALDKRRAARQKHTEAASKEPEPTPKVPAVETDYRHMCYPACGRPQAMA